jgi:hypothetical protein
MSVSGLLARKTAPLDLRKTGSRPDNSGRAPNSEQKQVKDRGHAWSSSNENAGNKAFWAAYI